MIIYKSKYNIRRNFKKLITIYGYLCKIQMNYQIKLPIEPHSSFSLQSFPQQPFLNASHTIQTYIIHKLHSIFAFGRVQTRFLTQRSAHEVIRIVMHLSQKSILGLKLSRKLFSLHQRSILPLQLPFYPLLPCLARVHHWIDKFLLLFLQKVGDFADFFIQNKSLQHHLIIHISICIFFTKLNISLRILYLLLLL